MDNNNIVGKASIRVDSERKATGRATFVDDIKIDRCLHGKVLTSKHTHALIKKIDTENAKNVDGVVAVMTAADLQGENQVGVILFDQPLMPVDKVRNIGEAVALIAAETKEVAEEACKLIEVEYKPLPGIFSHHDGIRLDAIKIHEDGNVPLHLKIRKGDWERGFRNSETVIEAEYDLPFQEHMYIETLAAIAIPEPNGTFLIYGSIQCPYYVQRDAAKNLGVGINKVRVVQAATGGAFGGKEDVPSQTCSYAAVLAQKTGRPVKLVYKREEDAVLSSKRHPMTFRYKVGAKNDGMLQAMDIEIIADLGAYATLSPAVLFRATVHATGPYVVPNVKVDTYGVYTNNPQSGAFRGFGAPQAAYGSESVMDELAQALGMDPLELRLKNAFKVGSKTATSQVLNESVGLVETIEEAEKASGWKQKKGNIKWRVEGLNGIKKRGIGMGSLFYGNSLGAKGKYLDAAGSYIQVWQDGSVSVSIGCTELGQGAFTIIAQIAAEGLGVPLNVIQVTETDTNLVPDSGPTVASRVTGLSGRAVLDGVHQVKKRMLEIAGDMYSLNPESLAIKNGNVINKSNGKEISEFKSLAKECYNRKVDLTAAGWYAAPPTSFPEEDGQGDAYYIYSYGTQIAEVEVDMRTGQVEVVKVTAAHDVGKAINPKGIEGQIEGGVSEGIGYAIYENFQIENGIIKTPNFTTYILPTSLDSPEVTSIIVESAYSEGPFGAKSLAEPCIIPTAAAISNAVADAIGIRIRSLPLTPEKVLKAIREAKEKAMLEEIALDGSVVF